MVKTKKKTTKKKSNAGRKTKFKEEYCELAKNYAFLGVTDKQLAQFFEVDETTIYEWKNKFPQFSQSLKEGKEIADNKVAKSLFERATGYDVDELKLSQFEGYFKDEKIVNKHYPPDVTACIFWLKNRRPDLWRDKIDANITADISVNIVADEADL